MSTAVTDHLPTSAPHLPTSAAPEAPSTAALKIPYPYLWLLGILVIAGLLRWYLSNPFQVEEFPAAAAVLERQGVPLGFTAAESDPLVPVASLEEVSQRSVIPYGVRDPFPLYHDLLWLTIKVLPPSDWALRLPSLLAGIGCVAVVFFLVKRFLGMETALAAALFAALDPVQLALSWQARPYALGNLFAALSFLAVVGLLSAKNKLCVGLWALGYGIFMGLVGYCSPAMLVVVGAHVAMIVYVARTRNEAGIGLRIGLWAGGVVLAALLLTPEFGYYADLWRFGQEHGAYLAHVANFKVLTTFFFHNLTLIAGLLLVVAAGAVVRWQMQPSDEEPATEGENADPAAKGESTLSSPTSISTRPMEGAAPATSVESAPVKPEPSEPVVEEPLSPEHRELIWFAMFWVLLPQLLALMGTAASGQPSFATRFMGFTTLGGAILLAAFVSRERTREARLGIIGGLALGILVLGFFPDYSAGVGLFGNDRGAEMMQLMRTQLNEPTWQDGEQSERGDVILMRSALPEVDFVKSSIPEKNREAVKRVGYAPVATLYADARRRPVILLAFSQYRTNNIRAGVGQDCQDDMKAYYDEDLVKEVFSYKRYWIAGMTPRAPRGRSEFNSQLYLASTMLWLADSSDWDLSLARHRGESGKPEHYVFVPSHVPETLNVDGLTDNYEGTDFGLYVHLARRKEPGGIFTLGVLTKALAPNAYLTMPVEFATEYPTPSLATVRKTKEDAEATK